MSSCLSYSYLLFYLFFLFFFLMIRRPPRSTLFPTRRSSDLILKFCKRVRAKLVSLSVMSLPRGRYKTVWTRLSKSEEDRKSTRLNSSHVEISYAVFCLKKKKNHKLKTN